MPGRLCGWPQGSVSDLGMSSSRLITYHRQANEQSPEAPLSRAIETGGR